MNTKIHYAPKTWPVLKTLVFISAMGLMGACQSIYDQESPNQCDRIETRNLPHCTGGHQPELPPKIHSHVHGNIHD